MFIATEAARRELRQEFHVPVRTSLHFTPDGVTGARAIITINIALLDGGPSPTSVKRSAYHRSH